jgi:segregation and condensation protein A
LVVEPIEPKAAEPELASAPDPALEEEPAVEPSAEPIAAIAEGPDSPAAELPVVVDEPAPSAEPVLEPVAGLIEPPVEAPEEEPVIETEATVEAEPAAEPTAEVSEEPELPATPEIADAEATPVEPVADTEPISSTDPVPEQEIDSTEPVADETELLGAAEPAPEEVNAAEPETVDGPIQEPETAIVPAAVAVPEPAVAAAPEPAQELKPEPKPPIKTRDDAADLSPFSVIVSQVYDGPLDLLLDLIRKQDIDIYDIPIARITSQFLAYVNQLKATDVDVAGEFIYIASLLIHIKSKMLLPRAAAGPDDAAEDPRRELVERLLEHERFKNAAQMLQQKQMLEAASWTNPGIREFKDDAAAEPEIAADTVDLVRIFRDILERARRRPVFNVDEDAVTVGQMMQFLARRLNMEDKPVALHRLLSHTRSERALVAMFLALLELVRLQAVLLRQDKAFSEIFIKKHTAFDAVMNDGVANAPSDEWR